MRGVPYLFCLRLIDSAVVAMQPRSISPKGNKVCEREFVIVEVSDHRTGEVSTNDG